MDEEKRDIEEERQKLLKNLEEDEVYIQLQEALAKSANDTLLLAECSAHRLTNLLQKEVIRRDGMDHDERYLAIINILDQAKEIFKDIKGE